MIGKYFYSVRRRIREFFLLEEARLRYEALTDSRRRDLRFYHHAGIGRLRSARDVRGLNQLIPSLVLYRQAGLFFALAFLLSKNENPDTGRLTPDTIVDLLDSSLATHPIGALPWLDRLKFVLTSHDPLAFDRLPAEGAARLADELEVTCRSLADLVDARTAGALRVTRLRRIAIVSVSLLRSEEHTSELQSR